MAKRGLSDIVTTVLIILVAIAAIVVVWSFIRTNLSNAGFQIEAALSKTALSIPKQSIMVNKTNTSISFVVKRDAGTEKLSAILVVLKDINQTTASIKYNQTINELETLKIGPINYSNYSLSNITEIIIAPIILSSSGKIFTGAPVSYSVSSSSEITLIPPVANREICGNNKDDDGDGKTDCVDTDCAGLIGSKGETCEPSGETICNDNKDNDADGKTDCADKLTCAGRSAPDGGTCQPDGTECGDGICNNEETPDNCFGDCPPCIDDNETNETCSNMQESCGDKNCAEAGYCTGADYCISYEEYECINTYSASCQWIECTDDGGCETINNEDSCYLYGHCTWLGGSDNYE